MKLYLSSLGIPDGEAYVKLFGRSGLFGKKMPRRVAIIATAWNVAPAKKSQPFIEHTAAALAQLGFETEQVDLAAFGGKKEDLAAKLAGFSGVWVTGGNCFYLNYWMHESGFDQLLPELFKKGFVYGGESAGSVLAGKTLHGVEVLDNPAEAPQTLWNGLCLVDYGILPHWGKPKYADRYQMAHQEMQLFTPVKTLSDTDFVIIK